MKCKICGNESDNKIYVIKERMVNQGEEFQYFLCHKCQTLQLVNQLEDMSKYYSNYRVFKSKYQKQEKKIYDKIIFHIKAQLFLSLRLSEQEMKTNWSEYSFLKPLRGTHIRKKDTVLDVGCGSGRWLDQMAEAGFSNLYGIDKYSDIDSKHRWEYRRGELWEAKKLKYDFITFHHSFEHMDKPVEMLSYVKELLAEKGVCIIRIPVFGKRAWKEYGVNWYQIDAPRHYFLYSEKAIRYLCKKAGLKVCAVVFDSDYRQFAYSEKYRDTELSLYEIADKGFSSVKVKKWEKEAERLNKVKDGDQAIFYIRKR